MLVSGVLLLYAGRHLTFFYDEWAWIEQRRGSALSTYLDPHNGHLSLFPVIVYKLLFRLVGLRHYTPYRVVGVLVEVLCGALLYVLVRRRLGPWLALVPATLLLFMGTAFQDLLWPFQLGFLSSVAGGLLALALLERGSTRANACACAALVWSLSSSGVGLAFLAACAVLLILQRDARRRVWIVAVPAALFLVWYIGWGTSEQITSDSVLAAPQYIADAASATFAGIAGLRLTYGPALAVAGLALIAAAWTRHGKGQPTPMLLAATAGALTFWGLSAIARTSAPDPSASRYLYVGAVFIYLVAAEAGLGASLRGGWLALGGLAVAGALIANIAALRTNERGLRADDASVRASSCRCRDRCAGCVAGVPAQPDLRPRPHRRAVSGRGPRPRLAGAHADGAGTLPGERTGGERPAARTRRGTGSRGGGRTDHGFPGGRGHGRHRRAAAQAGHVRDLRTHATDRVAVCTRRGRGPNPHPRWPWRGRRGLPSPVCLRLRAPPIRRRGRRHDPGDPLSGRPRCRALEYARHGDEDGRRLRAARIIITWAF